MKKPVMRDGNRMTVREVAEALGCTPEAVRRHIRELFPDVIANGKTTYLTEMQVTLLIEKIRSHKERIGNVAGTDAETYKSTLEGAKTDLSDEVRLALLYKQDAELMKEAAGIERNLRIKAEQKQQHAEQRLGQEVIAHDRTRRGLETYQRIAEAAGLVRTDQEDLLETYRREKHP